MKRSIAFMLVFFMLAAMTGCEPLKKKFTRKPKTPVKMPRIYQVKKYEKKPTPQLYQKHYSYWVTWQSELIKVLGQNHKKDVMCIEQIISNLKDMQNILVKEKGDVLAPHIANMDRVKDVIIHEDLSQFNKDYVSRTLEKEDRIIKREFSPAKVRNNLKKSFEEDDAKNQ